MRVAFFGTYDEERHPRVRVLRQGLAAHGDQVMVINRPLRDSTAARVAAAKNPLAAAKWVGKLLATWARLLFVPSEGGKPEAVVVGYLGVLDVFLARFRWPRSFIVLDHMAPLAGVAVDRGLPAFAAFLFRLVDRAAEAVADLVIFDTEANAALSSSPVRKRLVVPVGAPDEWFEMQPSGPAVDFLDVVFFGLHTPLQGTPVIGDAIRLLAEEPIRFTMIGTGQDLQECRERAGDTGKVTWLDWVDGGDLPAVVTRHQVCLGIFGTTPKAARVVPNKVYQAAAAGCAVVTRGSPTLLAALGDSAVYVDAGSGQELAEALRRLANDPDALAQLRTRGSRLAVAWRPDRVTTTLFETIRAQADRTGS